MASDHSSESGSETEEEMYEELESPVEEIENASLMIDLPQFLDEDPPLPRQTTPEPIQMGSDG
jgi:hypothetical protein